MSGVPTGTVGVVLADTAGSTRLWEDHGSVMPAVVARLDEIVDAAAVAHDGVRPTEQGEGDSFVVAFARVSDALSFALDVQLATRTEPWPEDIALRVRMAVHAGEVALRDEANYLGSTMNRAGRLRALAAGGQTLVSGPAADLADNRLPEGATLADLGTHRLRDLERPERVFELSHPDIDEDHPQLRSLDVVPNNLPAQLTSFVGREAELAQLSELLANHRLVTVTGPGGAGKTRLALHAAAEVSGRFDDGVWFVDLSEITDADLVPQAIADATGAVESAGRTGVDAVAHHLSARATLVVLDNCEHLVAAAATTADRLLRACPSLTILATSREPIGVDGEVTWRIPTLSLPGDDDTATLITSEAVQLFIERALATRPNFAVTNDNAPAVAQICARLDGIPLAIELAAARVRVLSPAQIAAGLDDRFRLLGAGPRTALPRQATLAASVDWSVDLLEDAERCLLARLSVFAGSFDLDAAEAVCGADPLAPHRVLDLLDALVQKSLVVSEEHPTATRYRLLETIRQYARARLSPDEVTALRSAHARHYAEVAWRSHTDYDAVVGGALGRLHAEAPNLRAALEHSLEVTDAVTAQRLGASLLGYWANRGVVAEGVRWLTAVLALEGGNGATRARASWGVGWLAAYTGDVDAQLARATEALSLAEEAGDNATAALAVATMTSATSWLDPEAAAPLHERLEGLLENGADRDVFVVVHTCFLRGTAYAYAGEFHRAREILATAVEIQARSGGFSEIGPKAVAAFCAAHEGDIAAALRDGRDAVDEARAAGSIFWLSMGLLHLAATAGIAGEHTEARAALAEASAVAATMTNDTPRAYIDGLGAALGVLLGESPGVDQVMRAVERLEGYGLHRWAAPARAAAAEIFAAAGDVAAARRQLETAITYAAGKPLWNLPVLLLLAARICRRTGDCLEAEATAHDGLAGAVLSGARAYLPPLLDQIAGVLVDVADDDQAVRLLAASDAARRSMGTGSWPLLELARRADIARSRERLGEEAFEQAWAEGAALDLNAAVAYARRGRGKRSRPTVGWASLTPVERDVVDLVADGLTNDQVAEKLFISRNTVRTHLRNVFAKLNVSSRTELAAAAHKHAH